MVVRALYSHEIEQRREELVLRLEDAVTSSGGSICSRLRTCTHVHDNIKACNMNLPEAYAYISIVCGLYPNVCELNMVKVDI